jgi:GTP-binding protein Era
MNQLIGEKLSIVTAKAQTTRNRILGIINAPGYQVIFSDTPGVLEPSYKLQESMLKSALSALEDADLILYLTDITEKPSEDDLLVKRIREIEVPVLLLINKIDLSSQSEVVDLVNRWDGLLPEAEKIPVSALKNFNIDVIFNKIIDLLPESPPYFDKDQLTDKSERFFAGEFIREKILLRYKQEIPYSVEVEIEQFKESENLITIHAIIYVERESQKGILIGSQGRALKNVGRDARLEMEKFFNKKVFLQLYVKVSKDWRNSEQEIKKFGYR